MCQELHTPVLGFVLSGPVTARKTLGIVPSWVKFANHRFNHPYEKKQGRGGPAFLSGISRLLPLELLSLSGPSLPGSGGCPTLTLATPSMKLINPKCRTAAPGGFWRCRDRRRYT
jgi:hypothetical protein